MEERDVVRVRKLLRRRSRELPEADREHGSPQRMLERLSRAQVGRKRKGADHLCGADRPLARRHARLDRAICLACHAWDPTISKRGAQPRT